MKQRSRASESGDAVRSIGFRIWFVEKGRNLLGKGGAEILESMSETHSISKAAKQLGRSYRQVWGQINEIEESLGQPLITRFKGGARGGGGAELTPAGLALLKEYRRVTEYVNGILKDEYFWEACGLKLSARNKLSGKIISVEKNGVVASIKIRVMEPATITSVITSEAADDLDLKEGDDVEAIVKATEVLISKED
ncbi:MAG: TOBE domain-containing protein [Promethearchaeati archaeon SRVP18_Atabeyarchaeia-1]